jgi:hypothetical protein
VRASQAEAEEIVAKHLPPESLAGAIRLLREDTGFLESVLRVPSLDLPNPKDYLLGLVQCMHPEAAMPHAGSELTHTPCLG